MLGFLAAGAGSGSDTATGAPEVSGPPQQATSGRIHFAQLSAALSSYAVRLAAERGHVRLFDSRASLGFPPASFASRMVLAAAEEPAGGEADEPAPAPVRRVLAPIRQSGPALPTAAQVPPVPASRPRNLALRDRASASRGNASATAQPSIFEKLFGKLSHMTLAYAAPEDGTLTSGMNPAAGRYDRWTAVYDISAHTVYLPNGTKLEAHSGYGARLDDPRYVHEKNRGATPPNVYDLELREGLFHGVQAIRLIPVDEEKVYGRSGLLAHTFMLGPSGQSNGCVSFRNYDAFLKAYLNHEIKRLVVVARLD